MNPTPNLIPMHRQLRTARADRLRAWAFASGALAVVLALSWFVLGLTTSRATAPPPEAFAKSSSDISQSNEESARLRRRLAGLRELVSARQSVHQRADASALLAILAQSTGDDVVLNYCELTSRDRVTASSPQMLKMTGAARNQPAVAAFMLALEGTGLFKNVALVRSSRQQLMSTQVAGFQVECVIAPQQGGSR